MRTLSLVSFLLLLAAAEVRAQTCDPALKILDDGTGLATPVVISEVKPGPGGFIEFFNPGAVGFNLTGYWMCSPFNYALAGAVVVPAGGYATIPWPVNFLDTAAGGEIMLYKSSNFGTSTDIVDYVCWGASNQFRYNQAVSVGKWVGACAPALTNGSISRRTSTTGTNASSYDVTLPPSPMNCVPAVTGIGDTPSYPVVHLTIGPNPFSAVANIEFSLSSPARVSASVYSVTGSRVRTFETANYHAGETRLLWDGKDNTGHDLPSGTYLLRVSANSSSVTQRVTILR
jgi:hypothetical protein